MGSNEELADTLEQVVDRYSLGATLEALLAVCQAKADHLEANWQDAASARPWRRLAVRLATTAAAAQKERV